MVLRKLYKNRGKVILIVAAVLFYLFSPYRIQISHGDAPYKQLFSFISNVQFYIKILLI